MPAVAYKRDLKRQMSLTVCSDRRFGCLFGYPLAHTLSPLLHNTIFRDLGIDWSYETFESRNIDAFLRLLKDSNCYGSAVTMPHKVVITQHLDELTVEGREVGACNTVYFRADLNGIRRSVGTNTDVIGVREAFLRNVQQPMQVRPNMNDAHERPRELMCCSDSIR